MYFPSTRPEATRKTGEWRRLTGPLASSPGMQQKYFYPNKGIGHPLLLFSAM
jgi:hypothetical protein